MNSRIRQIISDLIFQTCVALFRSNRFLEFWIKVNFLHTCIFVSLGNWIWILSWVECLTFKSPITCIHTHQFKLWPLLLFLLPTILSFILYSSFQFFLFSSLSLFPFRHLQAPRSFSFCSVDIRILSFSTYRYRFYIYSKEMRILHPFPLLVFFLPLLYLRYFCCFCLWLPYRHLFQSLHHCQVKVLFFILNSDQVIFYRHQHHDEVFFSSKSTPS